MQRLVAFGQQRHLGFQTAGTARNRVRAARWKEPTMKTPTQSWKSSSVLRTATAWLALGLGGPLACTSAEKELERYRQEEAQENAHLATFDTLDFDVFTHQDWDRIPAQPRAGHHRALAGRPSDAGHQRAHRGPEGDVRLRARHPHPGAPHQAGLRRVDQRRWLHGGHLHPAHAAAGWLLHRPHPASPSS